MSLAFIFVSSFLVAMSGALMPGPLLTVTIKESLRQGWLAGVLISAGHGIAEIILIGLFALGFNRFLQTGWISAVVGIVGGSVLILMGYDIIKNSFQGIYNIHLETGSHNSDEILHDSSWRPLWEGVIVSVANPGWVVWWFSIGILYVTSALQRGWMGISSFYSGHILADFTWYVFIAYAVATGKRFLGPRAYQWILGICGIFMVALALFFFIRGVQAALRFF